MASAAANSKKLKGTLAELESALTTWDQIIPAVSETPSEAAASAALRSRGTHSSMPEEMKRRTRELLNQLKEQIEDLSTDEKPNC